MIGKVRLWIVAASVVSLAALSAVSWLSYRNTKELITANQRLARAHKMIEDLAALHVLLDDAETSCRDYALSGRTESLKPYEAALAQLDVTMQVLHRDLCDCLTRARDVRRQHKFRLYALTRPTLNKLDRTELSWSIYGPGRNYPTLPSLGS